MLPWYRNETALRRNFRHTRSYAVTATVGSLNAHANLVRFVELWLVLTVQKWDLVSRMKQTVRWKWISGSLQIAGY